MTSDVLTLNMQQRTATLTKAPSGQFGKGLPFEHVATILKNEPLEFFGQQNADGVKTNVFRHVRELSHGRGESMEIWLDAESKRLVKYCTTPGNDYFDPQTAPDRHNVAEAQFSKGTIAGVIHRDIAFDAQLDPSLFSLTPPTGFVIVDPPQRVKVTEELMIQWLRLSAEANGGVFLGLERGINMQWHNAIVEKPETERTAAEQKYVVAAYEHIRNGNTIPVQEFADSFTVASSFRYLGKGIQLGDKDRIVCFYKFKSTGTYRAVYGNLSVKDVNVNVLPLPVE